MINDSNQFANLIMHSTNNTSSSFRMAIVSSSDANGVYLTFNGESAPREKGYKRLSSYTPNAGDKVICAILNDSYTVLGKVE